MTSTSRVVWTTLLIAVLGIGCPKPTDTTSSSDAAGTNQVADSGTSTTEQDGSVASDGGASIRDGSLNADASVGDGGTIVTTRDGSTGGDGASQDASPPDGGEGPCTPGTVVSCDCPDGQGGTRHCLPNGTGFSSCDCTRQGIEYFVSVDGSDTASGSRSEPFATVDRARQAVRALKTSTGLPAGGVTVWIAGGTYLVHQSITLGTQDSGEEGKPVIYRALPGPAVRLVGGQTLSPSQAVPLSSTSPAWNRVDPTVRDRVVTFDLKSLGITDYGTLVRRGFCQWSQKAPLELFVNGRPMQLARWPDVNEHDRNPPEPTAEQVQVYGVLTPDVTGTYVKDSENDGVSHFARQGLVVGKQYYLYRHHWQYQGNWFTAWFLTTNPSGYPNNTAPWWHRYASDLGTMTPANNAVGSPVFAPPHSILHGFALTYARISDREFQYAGDRPARWTSAPDAWMHGYWKEMWADCHVPVDSIDITNHRIRMGDSPGYGVEGSQPWYAYNLLEEISVPGEWYLDRTTGVLYLLPPDGFAQAEIFISMLSDPLVNLSGAHHVVFKDVVIEGGRGNLLNVSGGSNRFDGITLRNSGAAGAWVNGDANAFTDCHVHAVGGSGIELTGGDRTSLRLAENVVANSHFHEFGRWDWTYRPAVSLSGAGHRVRHNLIHTAPHSGILFGGNEHIIELNEIHNTNRFSSDAGAIYGGRDWGARGNVIRHNFIHHLSTVFEGWGVHAIYLDDCLSGIRVEGNIAYMVEDVGMVHGGGRDNVMVNNVVARSGVGLSSDARGYTWRTRGAGPNNTPGDSWNLLEKLLNLGYQQEPWLSRYPACAAIPSDWNAIIAPDAHWLYPEGCVFSRNLGFQVGSWMKQSDGAFTWFTERQDNLEVADSPFVDEANLDLTLRPEVVSSIPGLASIPFARMGIVADP